MRRRSGAGLPDARRPEARRSGARPAMRRRAGAKRPGAGLPGARRPDVRLPRREATGAGLPVRGDPAQGARREGPLGRVAPRQGGAARVERPFCLFSLNRRFISETQRPLEAIGGEQLHERPGRHAGSWSRPVHALSRHLARARAIGEKPLARGASPPGGDARVERPFCLFSLNRRFIVRPRSGPCPSGSFTW